MSLWVGWMTNRQSPPFQVSWLAHHWNISRETGPSQPQAHLVQRSKLLSAMNPSNGWLSSVKYRSGRSFSSFPTTSAIIRLHMESGFFQGGNMRPLLWGKCLLYSVFMDANLFFGNVSYCSSKTFFTSAVSNREVNCFKITRMCDWPTSIFKPFELFYFSRRQMIWGFILIIS